jgi:predicted dehydrogenase
MIGHGFMGDAHSRATAALALDARVLVRRVSVSGRDRARLDRTAMRFGWSRVTTDWRSQIGEDTVDVIDNVAPNAMHAEPCIAAARAGQHVLCEKPLAPTAALARKMWEAAESAGVVHACGFNWRFFPAVDVLRSLVDQGELGKLRSVQAEFVVPHGRHQDTSAWRSSGAGQAAGVIGDLMIHHIDLVRYVVGELVEVQGRVAGEAQDQASVLGLTEGGASVLLHASRSVAWPTVTGRFEVRGTNGSVGFSLESLNELNWASGGAQGRRFIYAGDSELADGWYPRGHPLGWDVTFVHQLRALVDRITEVGGPTRRLASFEDGVRALAVAEAIESAAENGHTIVVPG